MEVVRGPGLLKIIIRRRVAGVPWDRHLVPRGRGFGFFPCTPTPSFSSSRNSQWPVRGDTIQLHRCVLALIDANEKELGNLSWCILETTHSPHCQVVEGKAEGETQGGAGPLVLSSWFTLALAIVVTNLVLNESDRSSGK